MNMIGIFWRCHPDSAHSGMQKIACACRARIVKAYAHIFLSTVLLLGSFCIATSCHRAEAPTSQPELPPETAIDFYGSKDIADAHAAIPQYKLALSQGDFATADELAHKNDFNKTILQTQLCNIFVFSLCKDCSDGKCNLCHGEGVCLRCSAGGACHTCKGEGRRMVPCNSCICQHCGGSGGCPACRGFGKKQCSTCLGTGYGEKVKTKKCQKCLGKGTINFQLTPGARRCPVCRGSGKIITSRVHCSSCNGSGRVMFQECKGTGRCIYCGGVGRNPCSICGGKGQYIQTCPECNGSGECPICSGTHVCPTCHGNKSCPTCAGRSSLLQYTLIADRSWLKTNGIIYSTMLTELPSLYAPKVMLDGRCIIMPPNLRNGVAIIDQASNYVNAANSLLIKE